MEKRSSQKWVLLAEELLVEEENMEPDFDAAFS
jgi:hypothetical protein